MKSFQKVLMNRCQPKTVGAYVREADRIAAGAQEKSDMEYIGIEPEPSENERKN